MCLLGRMSLEGEGVPVDVEEARHWLEQAVAHGDRMAGRWLTHPSIVGTGSALDWHVEMTPTTGSDGDRRFRVAPGPEGSRPLVYRSAGAVRIESLARRSGNPASLSRLKDQGHLLEVPAESIVEVRGVGPGSCDCVGVRLDPDPAQLGIVFVPVANLVRVDEPPDHPAGRQ